MRVRKFAIGGFGALLLALVFSLTAAPAGVTVEDLFDADRAFAQAAAMDGLEGWMSYMTDDAARMPTPGMEFVTGSEAIRTMDGPLLDNPDVRLTWDPEYGHLFDDGRHGFTTGPYEVVRLADGAPLGRGQYLTFWRLTGAGWKVAFDTGVAGDLD